jgi:hypothetical protein
MKEPVDHILRPSLPWRRAGEGSITECGYDATKVKTLTREEFFSRVKELGQQRAAMLTCMTCSDTAKRWGTWEDDPRMAVQREIEWERGGSYWSRGRSDRGMLMKDELTAINSLIENHREEFSSLVSEVETRRAWVEKKATRASKPKDRGGL